MQDDQEKKELEEKGEESDSNLSGFSQFIVGEIETIGGVLTGDPLTQAEGEFNVEVGSVREKIEEDLENDQKEEDKKAS